MMYTRIGAQMFAATLMLLTALASSAGAQTGAFRVDIPARPLAEALQSLADQGDLQIVFKTDAVKDRMAPAVSGMMNPEQALTAILAGTDLKHVRVGTAYVVKGSGDRATPPSAATLSREWAGAADEDWRLASAGTDPLQAMKKVADSTQTAKPDSSSAADEAVEKTDSEVTVTGSRIRTLASRPTIQPVLSITSEEIERSGASSLAEIFGRIPQVSSYALGQLVQTQSVIDSHYADIASTRVSASLRGAPLGGTLLLVNSRRVPKNGHESGNEGYDISGIPLAAIERIDVLLDGASAIYGSDAAGGVINVILKKEYHGTQVQLNYENTFDSDVAVKTASITHGFAIGRLSAMATLSVEDANSMMWADRWFLRTFDRRAFGAPDFRGPAPFLGTGFIRTTDGSPLPGLNPGLAAIPAGSDGVNVTVQDYANPVVFQLYDGGEFAQYSTPYLRKSVLGSLEHRITDRLTAFAELRWNENRLTSVAASPIPYYASGSARIPAGAPGNPFGVPIIGTKFFYDLPPAPPRASITENRALHGGLRGALSHGWGYEATLGEVRSQPDLGYGVLGFNAAKLAAAFVSPTPPILLYDSTAGISPNSPGTIEALTVSAGNAERVQTRTYTAQADGPLFSLRAGDVRLAGGTEYREDDVRFPLQSTTSTAPHGRARHTSGYFLEVYVPLISSAQQLRWADRLEARVAARHDRYSDFPAATKPSYGLLYRPLHWLTLRASHSSSYKVPTLSQLYRGAVQQTSPVAPTPDYFDALRGNQPVQADPVLRGVRTTVGGNPQLRPEQSESRTMGMVVEVPGVTGLSLSASYYKTEYTDRAGRLTLAERIVLFPETITRGPSLATDPAGWAGPVVSFLDFDLNIASEILAGYDFAARYNRQTRWGEFALNANANHMTLREVRGQPDRPLSSSSTPDVFPLQLNGSLFWSRGPCELGLLASFRDRARFSLNQTVYVPATIRWDFHGSYDFSRNARLSRSGPGWLTAALADTRIALTIFNLFNRLPPIYPGSGLPDNTVVDSRLRRFAVSLTKQF